MNTLKSYFDFTKGERNAAFFLSFLILLLSILPGFIQSVTYNQTDFTALDNIARLDSIINAQQRSSRLDWKRKEKTKQIFTDFNPNQASEQTLLNLGFHQYLAKRILKFRKSGGQFFVKSDLYKLYGIDSALVLQLWNYIQLPESRRVETKTFANVQNKQKFGTQMIELNSADTNQLIALPMIGSKLANRIVNYRNRLGGFYSIDQLLEVYGLKPETFDVIKPRIKLNPELIQLIDINHCSKEILDKHPYFGYKIAYALTIYRAQHGNFKQVEDLKQLVSLPIQSIEKIKNYIKFN